MRWLIATMLLCGLTAFSVLGGESAPQRQQGEQEPDQARRLRLWKSLREACPEKYRNIKVYGENDDLTVVCFRSERTTLMFRTKTGKVEPVIHMKVLPPVNRITYFENERGTGRFRLWHDGEVELTISSPD